MIIITTATELCCIHTQSQVATDPQTKSTVLYCESIHLVPHYHLLALFHTNSVSHFTVPCRVKGKNGKVFQYSLPRVGPGADPSVQAVSLQVTLSDPPSSRLPLLSARPAVTFPAEEHHRPLASTKLYCLVTRGRWVRAACPRLLPNSTMAGVRTYDL